MRFRLSLIMSALALSAVSVEGATAPEDRVIDEMAASSNNAAIIQVKKSLSLLKPGSQDEGDLLFALGELQLRAADLRFRTAHQDASKPGKAVETDRYESWLTQAISTFDRFLKKNPRDARVIQATYLRGRAHWELGNKKESERDFRRLADDFPESKEARVALEDLCSLLIEEEKYSEALDYLKKLQIDSSASGYATYLRNRSWAHFQLLHHTEALETLLKLLNHLVKMPEDDPRRRQYLASAAENLPVFFHAGYRANKPGFSLEQSFAAFRRAPRALYAQAMVGLAIQLRGTGDADGMEKYLSLVKREESSRPESLAVATVIFEGLVNTEDNAKAAKSARELAEIWRLHPKASHADAERALKRVAARFQSLFEKNRLNPLGKEYAQTLRTITSVVLELGSETPPAQVAELRYNLGSLALYLQDYLGAIEEFRSASLIKDSLSGTAEARFALADRAGLLPKSVSPRAARFEPSVDGIETPALPASLREELRSLAESIRAAEAAGLGGPRLERIGFECARAIYEHAGPAVGVPHLKLFVRRYPGSEPAPVAAALVMDTYVASQAFALADAYSREIKGLRGWKDERVRAQIQATGGDSRLKVAVQALKAGNSAEALAASRAYLESNGQDPRAQEASFVAGRASESLGDWAGASRFYARAAEGSGKLASQARIARAQLNEKQYRLSEASQDYAWLAATPEKESGLTSEERSRAGEKAVEFAWLSGSGQALSALLANSAICKPGNETCDRVGVLSGQRDDAKNPRARMIREAMTVRPLTEAPARWKRLNPSDQVALLPEFSRKVPDAFRAEGEAALRATPVRKQAESVKKRIAALTELEKLSEKLVTLPIAAVQARILKETSNLYFRTYKDVTALGSAEEWSEVARPFFNKANELDAQSVQIAMSNGVDETTLSGILGNRSSGGLTTEPKRDLSALLEDWVQEDLTDKKGKTDAFRAALLQAIESKNIPLIAFLASEGKRLAVLRSDTLATIQALIYDLAGAQAEAITAARSAQNLTPVRRENLNATLISIYARLGSKTKVRELASKSRVSPDIRAWAGIQGTNPAAVFDSNDRRPAGASP